MCGNWIAYSLSSMTFSLISQQSPILCPPTIQIDLVIQSQKRIHILWVDPFAFCSSLFTYLECFSFFTYSTYSSPTKVSSITMTSVSSSHRFPITVNCFLLNTSLPHCLKIAIWCLAWSLCALIYLFLSQISQRFCRPRPRVIYHLIPDMVESGCYWESSDCRRTGILPASLTVVFAVRDTL